MFNFPNTPTVGQAFGAYVWDGEKWVAPNSVVPPPAAALRSYLAGLGLSVPGGTNSFAINPGQAVDFTNTALMTLSSIMAKTTAAWSLGNGGGGLDTGAAVAANEWLTAFLIRRPDTGVVDGCISRSSAAPAFGSNIPVAYSQYRRIGGVKTATGSAVWLGDTRQGDNVTWLNAATDYSSTTPPSASLVAITLGGVPPGVSTIAKLRGIYNGTVVGSPFIVAGGDENAQLDMGGPGRNRTGQTAVANLAVGFQIDVQTNAAAQAKIQCHTTYSLLDMVTIGYIDRRGRDN